MCRQCLPHLTPGLIDAAANHAKCCQLWHNACFCHMVQRLPLQVLPLLLPLQAPAVTASTAAAAAAAPCAQLGAAALACFAFCFWSAGANTGAFTCMHTQQQHIASTVSHNSVACVRSLAFKGRLSLLAFLPECCGFPAAPHYSQQWLIQRRAQFNS
jgi:hypothetical protein